MFAFIRVLVLAWRLRKDLKAAGIPVPLVKEVPAIVRQVQEKVR